jgi:hypothetical protein
MKVLMVVMHYCDSIFLFCPNERGGWIALFNLYSHILSGLARTKGNWRSLLAVTPQANRAVGDLTIGISAVADLTDQHSLCGA